MKPEFSTFALHSFWGKVILCMHSNYKWHIFSGTGPEQEGYPDEQDPFSYASETLQGHGYLGQSLPIRDECGKGRL
jgi:hypothetical protein